MQAILFDMDGVLVDVSESYRVAIKKTAEHFLKKNIDLEEIHQYKVRGGYNNDWNLTEALMLSHGLKTSKDEIIERFQHFYLGTNFDGLIENERWLLDIQFLDDLHKEYRLGIVTGRPRKEANYVLQRFDVKNYFDVVITMEDIPPNKGKPDPYGLNLALKKLKVQQACYVGDNIDDIKSAVSAGVVPIGIILSYAYRKKVIELFKNAGAKYILRNINDIREVLG